jgi:hypothetical protein
MLKRKPGIGKRIDKLIAGLPKFPRLIRDSGVVIPTAFARG